MTPQQLKKELLKYDSQFLTELIIESINRKRDFKNILLEKFNEKIAQKGAANNTANEDEDVFDKKIKINDTLLINYWKDLKKIVVSSNKYGGCDYKEQNKADNLFAKLEKFLEKQYVSEESIRKVMKEAFDQMNIGNSGFDDDLLELMQSLCKEKEDWGYLVKLLESMKNVHYNSHFRNIANQIRLEKLADEATYLKAAYALLNYGQDYYKLANFYINKGENEKAFELMWTAMDKANGGLDSIYNHLFNHHANAKEDEKIDILHQKYVNNQGDKSIALKKYFDYYKDINYNKASQAILDRLEETKNWDIVYFTLYQEIKSYLQETDWQKNVANIQKIIKERDELDYLKVLMFENLKKDCLDMILTDKLKFENYRGGEWFEIVLALRADYPQEIADFLWKKTEKIVQQVDSSLYKTAAKYLKTVKNIYTASLKDEQKFQNKLTSFKEIHNRKSSLMKALEGI